LSFLEIHDWGKNWKVQLHLVSYQGEKPWIILVFRNGGLIVYYNGIWKGDWRVANASAAIRYELIRLQGDISLCCN
jgi:hypothetical protein